MIKIKLAPTPKDRPITKDQIKILNEMAKIVIDRIKSVS